MKYILIIITFIIGTIIVSANNAKDSLPLIGKYIIIDVGHGAEDPGTIYGDIYEKDINLEISKYLEYELAKLGASTLLTREEDYDLSTPNANLRKRSDFDNRINMINDSLGDYYLSIHINYLKDTSYSGIQVFYNEDDTRAKLIQNKLNSLLESTREPKKMNNYYMYDKLEIDGLLIECGFMSNKEEREKLVTSEYQKKIANAIAISMLEIF